jgi:hypothetical protein
MARMRIIKPDFWSDKNMVKLSAFARLFYIGSWNFTLCDKGHLPDDVEELILKILPRDPVDGEALLEECMKLDRIRRMRTPAGETFLWVPRLPNHQKLDERWKTRCPYCTAGPASPADDTETPGNSRESRSGSPELTETRPVVGSKGVGGTVVEGIGGAASSVTNSRAKRDLGEPPNNEPPGPAERILTEWTGSLRSPVLSDVMDQVGATVVEALKIGIGETDVAEGLRVWQARGNLGPRMLGTMIHDVSQRTPSTDLVIDDRARSPNLRIVGRADRRESTTDARVAGNFALVAELQAEQETRRGTG